MALFAARRGVLNLTPSRKPACDDARITRASSFSIVGLPGKRHAEFATN
jgi:hypothetical protein